MMKKSILSQSYVISIVVPIYNAEPYLQKCIESIINQTYTNLQIILVDDGSTDGSGAICDEYMEKDNRIQVIHKENGGPASARESGLALANGDYVGFVDGDDYIDKEFYETLLDDIIENKVDFVHMGYIYEENGTISIRYDFESKQYELSREISVYLIGEGLLLKKVMNFCYGVVCNLFERKFIQKCHEMVPKEQFLGEDLTCLCICLLEGKSMYMHKAALYHYVKRDGSLTQTNKNSGIYGIDEKIKLYMVLKKVFLTYGVFEALKPYLGGFLLKTMIGLLKSSPQYGDFMSKYYFGDLEHIKGKRIVIYGAGKVGQDYYAQLRKYTFCQVVGWIDKNCDLYHFDYTEVISPEQLKNLSYDIILISVMYENVADQIRQELTETWKISEDTIIWKKPCSIV